MQIDDESKKDIEFIKFLDAAGFFGWPIDFEPSDLNRFDASSWFENAIEEYEQHQFLELGRDGTGSGFCFWIYPDLKIKPPVVFWSSEGEFHFVAGSLSDYIRQLCSGKMFYDGSWLEPDAEELKEIEWSDLKQRAINHLGAWAESPEELEQKGRKNHPDFESWVNEHWE